MMSDWFYPVLGIGALAVFAIVFALIWGWVARGDDGNYY